MNEPKKRFVKVWWLIVERFKLSPVATLLLFLIYCLSRQTGYCRASKSFLAQTLNVSEQTVYTTLKHLAKNGLIERMGSFTKHGVRLLRLDDTLKELIQIIEQRPYEDPEFNEDIQRLMEEMSIRKDEQDPLS